MGFPLRVVLGLTFINLYSGVCSTVHHNDLHLDALSYVADKKYTTAVVTRTRWGRRLAAFMVNKHLHV